MRLLVEPKFDLYVDVITDEAKKCKDVIQLQWGELASVPPDRVKNFFVEAFEKKLTRYTLPHGDLELRRVLRKKLADKNGIRADVDNIIVTIGGTAAINFVFRILAGDGGYIVMNYPSNPTGYVFDVNTMKEVVEFARDHDVLILSDEAYEDYVFAGKHISIASIGGLDNIVSVFTISKTYSFTGLRIGYAVGPKEIIDAMALAQVHTYISPPSINQYVARRLLEENIASEIVKKNLEILRHNLKIVKEFAEENSWELMEPRGGIYAFIRLPGIDSAKFSLKLLREAKVAVAPGIDFGERWNEWLRITIAKSKSELLEGLRRIKKQYYSATRNKPTE